MTTNISDKDKKDWKNFLEKQEKLPNKDLENEENKFHITKSLDLHGFTLDEANKKVESFITDCFDQKISKVITFQLKSYIYQSILPSFFTFFSFKKKTKNS